MYPSAEVRWFFEGDLTLDVNKWFAGLGSKTMPESRSDWYLLQGNDNLSVKLRQGKVEVKWRLDQASQQDVIPFANIDGRVERWRKWSFKLPEDEETSKVILADQMIVSRGQGEWVEVHKERLLRKYEITKEGSVQELITDTKVNQGCGVEITIITIAGQKWWTLGFEAFAANEHIVLSNLKLGITTVFDKGNPPITLSRQSSMSYPAWLLVL